MTNGYINMTCHKWLSYKHDINGCININMTNGYINITCHKWLSYKHDINDYINI